MGLAAFEVVMIAIFRADRLALNRHVLLSTELDEEVTKDFLRIMLFRFESELRGRIVRIDGTSMGTNEILEISSFLMKGKCRRFSVDFLSGDNGNAMLDAISFPFFRNAWIVLNTNLIGFDDP
jgi:hypothetical protein